ncbi:MAG: tRNA uridine-5-carboxymethylaminomethyl(34) synthesis GTPase MnmE [Rhodospirillaceae bacterium]|nr:tRNA uridine-5-carboxymethylaminomethyl(34) synthesis GTPase MnmE [Rhodospirillaceae bacterium]
MNGDDTIFALASAPGRSGIAVLRVSGNAAGEALARLTRRDLPPPRVAKLRRLFDAAGAPIDDALVLFFPGPRSFTGEDVAELQVHGGPAVIAALLRALGAVPHCRLAEAGEFTRRAFLNHKLDLAQIEGLADLIAAETEAQRRQALRQAEGAQSILYDGWRDRLMRTLARLEAFIDFPDEDLPEQLIRSIDSEIAELSGEIELHLLDHRGERLRDGLTIAILGAPNAGKSSLLNALAQREAAIVAATAGTTRDVVEVRLDLGGYPVTIADTAGLRESADEIEREGIARALARARRADVKLLVFDGEKWPAIDGETAKQIDDRALLVVNKADLLREPEPVAIDGIAVVKVSAKTGRGLDGLVKLLTKLAAAGLDSGADVVVSRARHRQALEACREALLRAASAGQPELKAEDLRLAVRELGRITGRVDVEDILDLIFKEFCIGK